MAEASSPQPQPAGAAPAGSQTMPCAIKASVYKAGMAAGLGLKATQPGPLRKLLQDPQQGSVVRKWLRESVDAEIARRSITSGLDDAAVQGAIDAFVKKVIDGTDVMVVQKIATGEPPQSGSDGRLEYMLNPGGVPLKQMAPEDRETASRLVRRLKEGDVLVVRHPPEAGKDGCNVRGETVPPAHRPQEMPLEAVAGSNTHVIGEQIQAAVTGVYREDGNGRVSMVQEIAVAEVNATTGDLPRSGIATASFWVRGGVRNRHGVFTSENVFIGAPRAPAALDRETRVRARNLFIRGEVAGAQLAPEFLHGEPEKLSEADRHRAEVQQANAHLDIAETFGAEEVLGRPVSAGRILIRSQGYMSILNAATDVLIDGDLVGGLTSFGRRLQVAGNLGNSQNTPTRIRLTLETHAEKQQAQLGVDLKARQHQLEAARQSLENHQRLMEAQGKKSEYWAALYRGEKRVPKGPIERRLLERFFLAVKEKDRLAQQVAKAERDLADLSALAETAEETGESAGADLSIAVGGRIFPGVSVEMVTDLGDENPEQKVALRAKGGSNSTLQAVRQELAQVLKSFLEPREEQIAEKKEALEQMFEGREQKPPTPQVANKRFQIAFTFANDAAEADGAVGQPLPMDGMAYVYAQAPQQFYLKRTWTVADVQRNVRLLIRRGEGTPDVRIAPNEAPIVPWHRDQAVLEDLAAIDVMGMNARALLLESQG